MNEKNIELAITILNQDISACIDSFEKNNFVLVNIIANRYLENCLIFDDYKLCLPGVFIKDMANDYLGIINHPDKSKKINSAKVAGERLITNVRDFLKEQNEENLWNDFYIYNTNINEFLRDKIDANYLKNPKFSSQSFNFLLNYIENNIDYLYKINNRFLESILTIMARVIRNHYFNLKELMVYLYIKFLDFLYQYLYFENFSNNQLNKEKLKKDLSNYLEFIISLKEKEKIDIYDFNKNLWKIVKRWREMYIFYKVAGLKRGELLLPLGLKQIKSDEHK